MMHGFARSCIKIRQTDRSDSRVEVGEVPLQAGAGSRGIPQFGLVAEEVEKVNPDLVARDEPGKPYTVRYEAVNAMLLNEFLKEHRKVEALQASFAQQQRESRSTAAQQQNEIKALAATVKEQAAQIQKVSARLEASKPTPQVVNNNQ